jgi:hypothetical protein
MIEMHLDRVSRVQLERLDVFPFHFRCLPQQAPDAERLLVPTDAIIRRLCAPKGIQRGDAPNRQGVERFALFRFHKREDLGEYENERQSSGQAKQEQRRVKGLLRRVAAAQRQRDQRYQHGPANHAPKHRAAVHWIYRARCRFSGRLERFGHAWKLAREHVPRA